VWYAHITFPVNLAGFEITNLRLEKDSELYTRAKFANVRDKAFQNLAIFCHQEIG
jgi:hypothetical protein